RRSGVAHPRPRSHTLTRIAGDSTAMACFRPRPPRESEFATDTENAGGQTAQIALDEPSALARAVRKIAIERGLHNFDKKRHIADLVESEFKSRGEFYRTYDDLLFFLPSSERQLLALGRQEFADLLADISGLSQTETPFGYVLDRLRLLA